MGRLKVEIIVILILALIVIGVIFAFRNEKRKESATVINYFEALKIKDIKELHLERLVIFEQIQLHKKDDPKKDIEATLEIPVEIDAFTNMEKICFIKSKDSLLQKIVLPHSEYSPINIMIEEGSLTQYKKPLIIFGRENDDKIWQRLKNEAANTQKNVVQEANEHHLLNRADSSSVAYVDSLVRSMGMKHIQVALADTTIKK